MNLRSIQLLRKICGTAFTYGHLVLVFLFIMPQVQAQTLVLKGVVEDQSTASALPGAEVAVIELRSYASTDVDGRFSFGIPKAGTYTLLVKYLGYTTQEIKVDLSTNISQDIRVQMVPDGLTMDAVVLTAQALGQTKAINQQLSSDAIANFVSADRIQELPDVNAAEAIARLPGIAINRSGGEGQKVVIRGLEPKFAAITINGINLPSSSGSDRSVDLSLIAPELLDGIEVFKSPLPDMDAEAIGGTVNLRLRKAPKNFRLLTKGLSGYNALNDDFRDYKGVLQVSNRIFNDKLGVVFQSGVERFNRGVDIITNSWRQGRTDSLDNTEILGNRLRLEDRSEIRRRYNASVGLDYSLGASEFSFFGLFSRTTRNFFSMREDLKPGDQEIEYFARDRENSLNLSFGALTGSHKLGRVNVDWAASEALSRGRTPYDFTMRFFYNDDPFVDGFNPDNNPQTYLAAAQPDFSKTILRSNGVDMSETLERNRSATLNFELPLALGNKWNLTLKAGGKYKRIARERDFQEFDEDFYYLGTRQIEEAVARYDGPLQFLPQNPGLVSINSFALPTNEIDFRDFDGQNIGLGISLDPTLMRNWYDAQRDFLNENRFALVQNYEVLEQVSAGYFMAKFKLGDVLTIIPGFRYEYSNNSYNAGFSTVNGIYGVNGVFNDTTTRQQYGQFLPHFHIKYEPLSWLDIRASYAKTMARPDFTYITPRFRINDSELTILAGNPDLNYAVSTNYDLSVSAYKGGFGLISAGVFLKQIDNLFYPWQTFLVDDSTAAVFGFPDNKGYDFTSYTNSAQGYSFGYEIDFQTTLSFLPDPFSGLVFNINYARLYSETEVFFLTSETKLIVPFPPIFETIYTSSTRNVNLRSQAPHILRASLGYDYRGFSMRISAAYQGTKPNNYSVNKDFDTFVQGFWRYDASIKQQLGQRWSFFLNLNNFGNQRDISFTRSPEFTNSVQTYGLTGNLGLQFRI
ncbi:MAG: TonB-dependent receptor [Bacteroidota bacterium]